MSRLSPTVALGPDEAHLSFLSRLAARSGIPRVSVFCADMGLSIRKLVDGDASELTVLADLAGADPADLISNAFRRECGRDFSFRGERIPRSYLRRTRFRVCPACLEEDVGRRLDPAPYAPYVRVSWLLESVRTCPKHNIALIQPERETPDEFRHDYVKVLSAAADPSASISREASALELYLLGRLDAGRQMPESGWLTGLEWHVVAKTSEVMGVVARFGRKQGLRGLTDCQLQTAGAAGFEYLSRDEAGLRDFLDELFRTYPMSRRSTAEAQAVMGCLHGFLARGAPDRAFDPVREVARAFIVENFDLGAGEDVLGRPLERRKLHSLRSAHLQWDIHPKRLRKLLSSAGVIGPDQSALPDCRILMPAELVDEIVRVETESVDLGDLEHILGVGRPHPKSIRNAGLITAIPWTSRGGGTAERFSRDEIDRFLSSLFAEATETDVAPEGCADPVAAAKRACCSLIDVLRLILDGKLSVLLRVRNRPGLLALVVNIDEVKGLLHVAPEDGLAPYQVEKRIGTAWQAMKALTSLGVFEPEIRKNPVHGGMSKIIPLAQVEHFERTYVSLTNLAKEQNCHFQAVLKDLDAAGVAPAWPPEVAQGRWYRRADLLALFAND